ncbi:MAG: malonyl-CoA decarboxylase [Pseudomonadota bacterium]
MQARQDFWSLFQRITYQSVRAMSGMQEGVELMARPGNSTSFFERAWERLSRNWKEIAFSGTKGVNLDLAKGGKSDLNHLKKNLKACLEARGGEVSARAQAAELGRLYLHQDAAGRETFLKTLAQDFGPRHEAVQAALENLQASPEGSKGYYAAERELISALTPDSIRVLKLFSSLPNGVKFLVDLRADLLNLSEQEPATEALSAHLKDLLSSWFDPGILDLERITWKSSAALLEKLIAYEAVHEIRSWDDLRNRLDSDRRCYALFHPRMPEEPLAFVEVALGDGYAGSIQHLLDEAAPAFDTAKADTAIFYSISNTQKGLQGIAFGEYLIKLVVQRLKSEMPQVRRYATLSPVPGLVPWLKTLTDERIASFLSADHRKILCEKSNTNTTVSALQELTRQPESLLVSEVSERLKEPLLTLAACYFQEKRDDGQPIDPVARFHLRNGARLERINWLGDSSSRGLKQSLGIMVNYGYRPDELDRNHEAYMKDGRIALASEVKTLLKKAR